MRFPTTVSSKIRRAIDRSSRPRAVCRWLLALGVVLALQTAAWACPTCKDGLSQSDPTGQSLVQGYFWSILFMMSMPFLIFTALGGYFYWEIRKARSANPDHGMNLDAGNAGGLLEQPGS